MYQILFLLLTAAVTVDAYIACTPEICESQKPCTWEKKCPPPLFVGGPPPTTKCRDDLSCQKNEDGDYVCTCTCN
ncbi:hypothetical protein HNY73_013127 [Argiope bruennichi]|uniref:Uncharacterized protein n=1 Tax=Argiope bruennichi TaxID=94029 RepID=A0A8T0EYY0_ARGBR|nr:hypothetical protein HNY73_013127 [Argiope bruennichi]